MSFATNFRNTFNRLRRSHVAVALLLSMLLILWLASGDFLRTKTEAPKQEVRSKEETAFQVETEILRAARHSPVQVAQGQLEPMRAVEIRAQTGAHVTGRQVEWGALVTKGQLLFQLDPEVRAAELARAEADLALRQAELRGGEILLKKNLLSETEYLRLKSVAAAAKAEREQQALQFGYARIHAPFTGIVDRLPIEEGDYVQLGETLATLVDVSSLRLIAYIPQQQVHALEPGLPVIATLLDGTTLSGTLTFVASLAEESTRSFRVEARIDNPETRRIAGSSAALTIHLPEQQAHRLSPALLVLDEEGELGIKTVNADKRVEFLPLTILSFDTDGIWVNGLPDEVEIISLGAGFVAVGDAVNPVNAEQP